MPDSVGEIVPHDALAAELGALPSNHDLAKLYKIAKSFAASGIYNDSQQADRAFAKLVIGRDLGLNIAQSMQGIQFVRGQVQLHYSLLALCIHSRGYRWEVIERSDKKAAAKFFDPDGNDLETIEFTMEEAVQAGLVEQSKPKGGGKSMYEKIPKTMLWARMISQAVRFVIPEATGGIPVYVPGEIPPTTDGGAPAGEVAAPPPTLAEVVEDAPEPLRERFRAALEEAEKVRPGVVTAAAARMEVKDQPPERVELYILTLESDNANARRAGEWEEAVEDAQVVEDDGTGGEPTLPVEDDPAVIEETQRELPEAEMEIVDPEHVDLDAPE